MVGSSEGSLQINCYKGNGEFLRHSQKYFHVQRNSFYLEADIVPEHLPFYAIFIHVHLIPSFPRRPTLSTWARLARSAKIMETEPAGGHSCKAFLAPCVLGEVD